MTKLYTSYTNISQNNLQHEINTIYDWASIWQMQISYSKCNIFQISSNTLPQYYKIDNNIIAVVDSVTDLGVIVDADLRFRQHLNNIVSKANQRSALIKRSFLSKKYLQLNSSLQNICTTNPWICLNNLVTIIHIPNKSNRKRAATLH